VKASTVDIVVKMMQGDYEKSPHIHTCSKCEKKWPHDVKDCQWPNPWICPDCEEENES